MQEVQFNQPVQQSQVTNENPQVSVEDTPPVQEKKPKYGLLIVLILILLGVAGFFGLKYYQVIQEISMGGVKPEVTDDSPGLEQVTEVAGTEDWKTYAHPNNLFTFKYPAEEFTLEERNDCETGVNLIQRDDSRSIKQRPPSVSIMPCNILEKHYLDVAFAGLDEGSEETLAIDGVQSYSRSKSSYYSERFGDVPSLKKVVAYKNGLTHTFSLVDAESNPEYDAIFDKILKTFKFTGKEVVENNAAKGVVEGKICYPSEGVPPGYILAKNLATNKKEKKYYDGSVFVGQNYSIALEPGSYVFAFGNEEGKGQGFHTACALDLKNCIDPETHKLIEVDVVAKKTVENIDLCDFYYGSGPGQEIVF